MQLRRRLPLLVQLLTFALLCQARVVSAAHSRRRVVVRMGAGGTPRYDRSISTFAEDGRLAQVEYGMEASSRGSPAIVAVDPDGAVCIVVPSSFGKIHRIDHHLWMITAGLGGDGRALANAVRVKCQSARLSCGEVPTVEQAAKMAADLQHELTRTAGARPLGCTAILVGMDPCYEEDAGESVDTAVHPSAASSDELVDESSSSSPSQAASSSSTAQAQSVKVADRMDKPRIFNTDPGGIVEECDVYCVAGNGRSEITKRVDQELDLQRQQRNKQQRRQMGIANGDTSKQIEWSYFLAQIMLNELKANTMRNGFRNSRSKESVDVWMLQPNKQSRGGLAATCHQGVTMDGLSTP
uniref:Proteasome alpha-type subunits domain-containing protein n=1 Tax=Craspedostauros australis TaxID=1486917 RepID=A0A7R9ZT23_9STRA